MDNSLFCSIQDPKRTKAILQAAAVASSFTEHHPNLGIIGDPSDWLIASRVEDGFIKDKFVKFRNSTTVIGELK